MRSRKLTLAATAPIWVLSTAAAVGAARYFLHPVPFLVGAEALALARHPVWLLWHIAGGVVALVVGPFQFLGWLRASHPAIHRGLGYAYLSAVLLGGLAGLRLAPDAAQLMVDGVSQGKILEFPFLNMAPSTLGLNAEYDRTQFLPVVLGVAVLAMLWFVTSAMALLRVRQGRFSDHRAWMVRSYSLTFAAVTLRLAVVPMLLLTRNPVLTATLAFWSWILNLIVAEYLVRSLPQQIVRAAAGAA